MTPRRAVRRFIAVIALLVGLCLVLLILKRPRTPAIEDESGNRIPTGIASLEKMNLGGFEQWILIRGADTENPLLLFLHGGPGMPMMYLAHTFQRPLEDGFLCVQWDQRGAGKSFRKGIPPDSLSVERILSDALELIGRLRERFGQDRIFLAGHSWGSYLGMLLIHRHPELFHAFIGIGQVVDEARAREISEKFIRDRAMAQNNQKALLEIDTQEPGAHEKWLFRFGGVLYGKTGYTPLVWAGIRAPEYGLWDIPKVAKGSSFSSRHMRYDAISGPLITEVTEVEVPVLFFMGRHDLTTPGELVEEYFGILKAPLKRLVWFERSAHYPFFSEPEAFARELENVSAVIAR
jgi:pimeloyl-ACP methyl ester carboxylesterase